MVLRGSSAFTLVNLVPRIDRVSVTYVCTRESLGLTWSCIQESPTGSRDNKSSQFPTRKVKHKTTINDKIIFYSMIVLVRDFSFFLFYQKRHVLQKVDWVSSHVFGTHCIPVRFAIKAAAHDYVSENKTSNHSKNQNPSQILTKTVFAAQALLFSSWRLRFPRFDPNLISNNLNSCVVLFMWPVHVNQRKH